MDPIERLRQIENDPNASDRVRGEARAVREQAEHERRVLAKMDRPRERGVRNEGRSLVMGYGMTPEQAARRVKELEAQGVRTPPRVRNELDRIVDRFESSRGR